MDRQIIAPPFGWHRRRPTDLDEAAAYPDLTAVDLSPQPVSAARVIAVVLMLVSVVAAAGLVILLAGCAPDGLGVLGLMGCAPDEIGYSDADRAAMDEAHAVALGGPAP